MIFLDWKIYRKNSFVAGVITKHCVQASIIIHILNWVETEWKLCGNWGWNGLWLAQAQIPELGLVLDPNAHKAFYSFLLYHTEFCYFSVKRIRSLFPQTNLSIFFCILKLLSSKAVKYIWEIWKNEFPWNHYIKMWNVVIPPTLLLCLTLVA